MKSILRASYVAILEFPEAVMVQDSCMTIISLCLVSRVKVSAMHW